jgi:hypothetical protein
MSQPFPYPGENMTSVFSLFSYANALTDNFLGVGILITIAIISIIVTKGFSSDKAFGFAGFLCIIVAILLRFMSLINDAVLYITIIAFVGIVIWINSMREQETV